MITIRRCCIWMCVIASLAITSLAQPPNDARPAAELLKEIDDFAVQQRTILASKGKRYDAEARDEIERDKKALAKKYAGELASRTDLKEKDFYFLGRIYSAADNDAKVVESMKRFLAEYPEEAKGDLIQSALAHIVTISSTLKQMPAAEQAFDRWLKTEPVNKNVQPTLQDYLATGYYKAGQYEQSIRHAQAAFDLLKTLGREKSLKDKRDRETIYMNLVEVLALGYKKNKNAEQSISVLAEARAQSFALPSANLYRKVMTFVEGSGFSEKKLMQKVESYASADPAPEIQIAEWIGAAPAKLEELRGRVVLLDFWATWCGPCISTFPRLRGWHKKFGDQDFMIVGVTQYYGTQEGKRMSKLQELEYLREFKEKYKMPYPLAVAGAAEAAGKYGIAAYPTTVLLDRNGVVRYIGIGSGTEESDNLEEMIKKVLKEESRLAITP